MKKYYENNNNNNTNINIKDNDKENGKSTPENAKDATK
jgi:hypothetical protein